MNPDSSIWCCGRKFSRNMNCSPEHSHFSASPESCNTNLASFTSWLRNCGTPRFPHGPSTLKAAIFIEFSEHIRLHLDTPDVIFRYSIVTSGGGAGDERCADD